MQNISLIRLVVLEKKSSEWFLPYMGKAAILVMWPGQNIHIFFPPLPRGCIWNLIEIGPAFSEGCIVLLFLRPR